MEKIIFKNLEDNTQGEVFFHSAEGHRGWGACLRDLDTNEIVGFLKIFPESNIADAIAFAKKCAEGV